MEGRDVAMDQQHEPAGDRTGATDAAARRTRTRRGFLGAAIASLVSGLVIALLWLISRRAPSAGRDPALTATVGP
jgi:hypothetical protein